MRVNEGMSKSEDESALEEKKDLPAKEGRKKKAENERQAMGMKDKTEQKREKRRTRANRRQERIEEAASKTHSSCVTEPRLRNMFIPQDGELSRPDLKMSIYGHTHTINHTHACNHTVDQKQSAFYIQFGVVNPFHAHNHTLTSTHT